MIETSRWIRPLRAGVAVLTSCAGLSVASGQSSGRPAGQPAVAPGAKTGSDSAQAAKMTERAARAVARIAMLDLRLIETAGETDYQIADATLALAMELSPSDTDLIRRRIEANWNAGRSETALELTKRLITVDPSDTVAQLRYISGVIGKRQTAAERLALYDKFCVSPKIDPSVRSRLALDAALLAREGADPVRFRSWLKLATTLDSTNKEAAMLALSLFTEEHPDDAPGRVEMLSNLLMADPLDPHVYMTLSRQLADHGVFDQANRLHASGRNLLRKTGGEITPIDEVEALVLEWQVDGPAKVCFRISSNLAAQRRSIKEYNEKVRGTGIGIGKDLGEPEDLRLGADTEKVRLATALAADDETMAAASLLDMMKAVEYKTKLALDDTKRPLGVTREDALAQANAGLIDLQFWRVIAGQSLDKVEPDLVKFANGAVDEDLPGPDIVRALLTLRQGDAAKALTLLEGMMERLPEGQPIRLTTEYARGLALEALGRKEDAINSLRIVQRGIPLRPIGAMARFRIEKITGKPDAFSPDRAAIAKIAQGIPTWIDVMGDQPKSFMSVFGESPSTAVFGEDSPITISIRNVSQIPLAVGSDKPINSRFMLSPTLAGRASRLASLVRPEIVEADRVLRLMPRETLRVPVHPDLGYAGFVLDLTCDAQARVNWKLIQGFTPSEGGNFIAGPLSLASESPPVTRNPLAESHLPVEELVANIGTMEGDALFKTLTASRQRLWASVVKADLAKAAAVITPAAEKPAEKPVEKAAEKPGTKSAAGAPAGTAPAGGASASTTPPAADAKAAVPAETDPLAAERVSIGAALAARFPKLSKAERILVAAMMPHAGQVSEMTGLDDAIRADTDTDVMLLAVLTRVKEAEAPTLVAAKASSDPRLAELASLVSARLAGTGPCYAKLVPGLAAVRGEQEVPSK